MLQTMYSTRYKKFMTKFLLRYLESYLHQRNMFLSALEYVLFMFYKFNLSLCSKYFSICSSRTFTPYNKLTFNTSAIFSIEREMGPWKLCAPVTHRSS